MNKVVVADEVIDLRRGIDYIGVGVCMVVHDGQGNFLMMKRGEKARDEQGKWDICGGAIEFSESVDAAVRREIMEELCTQPLKIEFVTAYDAHREFNGVQTHWIQLMHAVKVDPETVKIGEPHKIAEIGWFNSTNLPEPRHSQFDKSFIPAKASGVIK
jgi:ADP-ribose pyrophosphatase YjhB (NUDIX family)